jgi:hypothetical protein
MAAGGNALLTIGMITREAVRLWRNSNAFIRNMDMQYDDRFAQTGAKIGSQLQIRLPNDYIVRNGPNLQVQNTNETSITLVIATQQGVDVAFNSVDRSLSLDDYSERVLAPAVNNLAGAVAANVMLSTEGGIANIVANTNSAGALLSPGSIQWLLANATLDNNSAPMANRKVVQNQFSQARIVGALQGLFNPITDISKQYVTGRMYEALGFVWMQDQTVLIHTNGTFATTNTVNGANQSGFSLVVNATTGTLNAGDIITLAGVDGVNKITKQDTGILKQFVVTAFVPAGSTAIPIYPAIIPPVVNAGVTTQAQYQTVTASPANGAAIVQILGASTQYRKNFAFCKEAVTLATADLELPGGVHEAARETFDGISMRMVTQYVIGTDQLATRLDILYGFLWIRPEWACIVPDVPAGM